MKFRWVFGCLLFFVLMLNAGVFAETLFRMNFTEGFNMSFKGVINVQTNLYVNDVLSGSSYFN